MRYELNVYELLKAMGERGYSAHGLSLAAGLSGRCIQNYVQGARQPSSDVLMRIASVLEVRPERLMLRRD